MGKQFKRSKKESRVNKDAPSLTPDQLELRKHKIELMKSLAAIRKQMKKGERGDQ